MYISECQCVPRLAELCPCAVVAFEVVSCACGAVRSGCSLSLALEGFALLGVLCKALLSHLVHLS